MRRFHYHTLDVFTDRLFGGNPLAVFPDAAGMTGEEMRLLARELNLSETVFCTPAEKGGTVRARIFTPAGELPFAGHPTIGTAVLLASLGRARVDADGRRAHVLLEEGVGPVPVAVTIVDGRPVSAQLTAAQPPELGPPLPDASRLASIVSLRPDDLLAGWPAAAVSCGLSFAIVPIRGDALGRARPDVGRWFEVLGDAWAKQVYLVTPDAAAPFDLRARMFGPDVGIVEDPATGSAAASLAGYLGRRAARAGTHRWTVSQGVEIGRPSRLDIEADVDSTLAVTTVRVGGSAVPTGQGWFDLPA